MKKSYKKWSLISMASIAIMCLGIWLIRENVYFSKGGTLISYTLVAHDNEHGLTGDMQFSELVYTNYEDLTNNSQYIAIGSVIRQNSNTRNLIRDASDLSKESATEKEMTKEFDFKVEKWLKGGTIPNTINLALRDVRYNVESPGLKFDVSEPALIKGQRYIVFLNCNKEQEYYFPTAPVWLFEISSDKKINAKTKHDVKLDKFGGYDENRLVKYLEKLSTNNIKTDTSNSDSSNEKNYVPKGRDSSFDRYKENK